MHKSVNVAPRTRPQDKLGRLNECGEIRGGTALRGQPVGYNEGDRFDPIETAPRAEIEALQERRLLETIPYAYAHSGLIRSLWQSAGVTPADIRSIADFKARAPFLDKDMQRAYRDEHNDPFGGLLCHPLEDLSVIASSGGTTGDPTLFAERWGRPSIDYSTTREYWHAGIRPGDYAVMMVVTMRPPAQTYFQNMGVIPLLFNHDPRELPRLVEWSRIYRPTVLLFISSIIIYGLEQLEKQGVDIREAFSSYKMCVYGGEPLGPRAKALTDKWGLKLYHTTAPGDIGMALECSAHAGHHIWEDLVLPEVLDPVTLQPIPDGGRGELVVTSLSDRMTPFLRYRSGDLVRFTREACACGSTHMRFWPLGRAGDELLIQGKSVLPTDIWPAIESVPETAAAMFQIIRPQREMSTLRLRVGYDGNPDLQALRGAVAAAVLTQVGLAPEVEFVPNSEMIKLGPPHKIPRVAKQ